MCECEADCSLTYEALLTVGAALASTAAAYADDFRTEGPKGLVVFQYFQDSFLCAVLLILNLVLVGRLGRFAEFY